jgi:hypothetical protein
MPEIIVTLGKIVCLVDLMRSFGLSQLLRVEVKRRKSTLLALGRKFTGMCIRRTGAQSWNRPIKFAHLLRVLY